MIIWALVAICVLSLIYATIFNLTLYYKHKESLRLLKKHKESWDATVSQAKKYLTTKDIQDFRKLQELVRKDLETYREVQRIMPEYKHSDEYLEASLDTIRGEEKYTTN
jgi:hypothetical protein